MGIAPYVAEAIVREHKFRPIKGDVLLLGRQTMLFSPDEAVAMVRRLGIEPMPLTEPVTDKQTLAAEGKNYIRDDAFFRLLGVDKVKALDHTNYEGAEIIHNLNVPLPEHLAGIADFILDGSTLDNLFSPATALQSIARLLRPNGRLIAINMATAHYALYTVFTPYWFIDYFALNRFADCRAYLVIHNRGGKQILSASSIAPIGNALAAIAVSGVVVFAEKGEASSWDRIPDQRHYASEELREIYKRVGQTFENSPRPHLLRSDDNQFIHPIRDARHQLAELWKFGLEAQNAFQHIDINGTARRVALPTSIPLLLRIWKALRAPIRR